MKDDFVNNFLSEASSLEERFADIYKFFGKLFVEDKDFWNQLSNEELKHEAILRSIQNTIALSGDFTSGLSNNLLQDVIKTKEWVSSLLVNFSKNPPDRKTAFEAATQIEKTASEVHYQGVMCQEADSWFIQTLQKLNEFDLDHLVRIERYIQEKNII